MKYLFIFILAIALISFSIISFSSNSYGTVTSNSSHEGGGGCGGNSSLNQQNASDTYLPPPSINFTPLPNPSLPSFPYNNYTIGGGNVTILLWNVSVPKITISAPNILDMGSFLLDYAEYIFEWIGVQIGNAILYVVQAIYLVFAYIEYWLLLAFIDISNSLGIFALPVVVSLLIVIGIVIKLVIDFAKDVTIILGA
ncbi:MAG: hypothetical protein ACP5L4_01835 [Thermoplasmata archaeon]